MNVKQYFKDFPGRTECFQTSDGYLFHLKSDAANYAKALKDDTVTTRKKAFEQVEPVQDVDPLVGEGEQKQDEAITNKPAKKAPRKKA